MAYKVVLIPGDGIGTEVTAAARKVLEATGIPFEWITCFAGAECVERFGTPLPQETIDAILEAKVALKGPLTTPVATGFKSVNVQLRKNLDLYANFRPAKTLPGVPCRYSDVDLIVIRENTEGLYSGTEHIVAPGVVESFRIITERASDRIVRFAFDTATKLGRKKVTAVHKANILKMSDGLFLDVARKVSKEYPEIVYDEAIVDATAMRMVLDPTAFDMLVMENLFGDILSDLAAGLIGGLGVAPSANIGTNASLFEAVHGSAPDIAGRGVANPTALVLSGAMMLHHLGEHEAAKRIEHAVHHVLAEGTHRTRDLGGSADTSEYTDALIRNL